MMNVFSKIRQKLLSQNRLTRYLVYALGEIFLVVIGILIALQVNTWKEERANRALEFNFYTTLLEDLENDRQRLDVLSKFYQNRIENLTWILERVRDPSLQVSPEEFGIHTEPLYYNQSAIIFNATFEASKSAGAFDRFSNKPLLKKLVEYYSNFREIEDVLSSITRFLEASFEPLMAEVPNNFLSGKSADQVLTSEGNKDFYALLESIPDQRTLPVQQEIDAFMQKTKFESYLIGDLGRTSNMVNVLKIRIGQVQSIQKEIESYIKD